MNMNWNEFFKPTWKKLLITIILVIIILFFVRNSVFAMCGLNCGEGKVNYNSPGSSHCECIPREQADMLELKFNIAVSLIAIIISYIISCLIFIRSSLNK